METKRIRHWLSVVAALEVSPYHRCTDQHLLKSTIPMSDTLCGNMSQYDANISTPLSIMSHSRLDDVCTFSLGI